MFRKRGEKKRKKEKKRKEKERSHGCCGRVPWLLGEGK
jgi:hypothetical protein